MLMLEGFLTGGFGLALVNSKSDRHRPVQEAVFIILVRYELNDRI